jgi:hypothetical protein
MHASVLFFVFVAGCQVTGATFLEGRSAPPAYTLPEPQAFARDLKTQLGTVDGDCGRPMDIVWCVDGSGSIKPANFNQVLDFISGVATYFTVSSTATRFGVVQFGGSAQVEISLGSINNLTLYQKAVQNIDYLSQNTNTNAGVTMSNAQMNTYGRSLDTGVARMIIILTDGEWNVGIDPKNATDTARKNGITVACITVGTGISGANVLDLVGGNTALISDISSFAGLNSGSAMENITTIACNAATSISNLVPTASPVACNTTTYLAYFSNVTSPVTLVANVSAGSVVLCFSYMNPTPTPDFNAPTLSSSSNTTCLLVGGGTVQVGTATAYPTSSQASGFVYLYTSVTGLPSGTDCGGNISISAFYCSVQLASGVTTIPGGSININNSTLSLNTTWIGDATHPLCSECPAGTAFLGNNTLGSVCASGCLGAAQYIDATGHYAVCKDCHPSCNTCVYPGTVRSCLTCAPASPPSCNTCMYAGTARSCLSCAPATPNLMLNGADPAMTSPYWQYQDALVVNRTGKSGSSFNPSSPLLSTILPTSNLSTLAGQCEYGCPYGYQYSANDVCVGVPGTFIHGPTVPTPLSSPLPSLLASFCIPPQAYGDLGPQPCTILSNSSYGVQVVAAVASLLSLPASSLFLRTCLSPLENMLNIYTYTAPGPSPAATIGVPNATALIRGYTSCSCAAVVTIAYMPMVSSPLPDPLTRAYALNTLSLVPLEQANRVAAAQALLSPYFTNASLYNASLCVVRPLSSSPLSPPLTPALASLVLCNDTVMVTQIPNASLIRYDPITLCYSPYIPPPNEPIPITPEGLPVGTISGITVMVLVLVATAVALFFYCSWRTRQLRHVSKTLRGHWSSGPKTDDWSKGASTPRVRSVKYANPLVSDQKSAFPKQKSSKVVFAPSQVTDVSNGPAEGKSELEMSTRYTSSGMDNNNVVPPTSPNGTVVRNPLAAGMNDPSSSPLPSPSLQPMDANIQVQAEPTPETHRGLNGLTFSESVLEFFVPGMVSLAPPPKSIAFAAKRVGTSAREARVNRMASAGNASRKLDIGTGSVQTEAVQKEAVILRPVDRIRGDDTYKSTRSLLDKPAAAYTAVVRRDVVAMPSQRGNAYTGPAMVPLVEEPTTNNIPGASST